MDRPRTAIVVVVVGLIAGCFGARAAQEAPYFPPHSHDSTVKRFNFKSREFDGPEVLLSGAIFEKWYGKQLMALKEIPVWNSPEKRPAYRFTWLRTWHHPMAFRVTFLENGTAELNVKMADGAGGYEPGKLILDKMVKLDGEATKTVRDNLESLDFWSLKAQRPELRGMDGAEWILEGKESSKYHIVVRWSGDRDISSWCKKLIELSAVDVGEIY